MQKPTSDMSWVYCHVCACDSSSLALLPLEKHSPSKEDRTEWRSGMYSKDSISLNRVCPEGDTHADQEGSKDAP